MKWFVPALAKSSVGSSYGTTGEEGHIVCPLASKNSMNCLRTFEAVHSCSEPAAADEGGADGAASASGDSASPDSQAAKAGFWPATAVLSHQPGQRPAGSLGSAPSAMASTVRERCSAAVSRRMPASYQEAAILAVHRVAPDRTGSR